MDLPNEKVVNPFQYDGTFKYISENDKYNKNVINEGSEMHLE